MKDILKFVTLIEKFQEVERIVFAKVGSKKWENDVEHSYGLAMLAWYLIDSRKLDLDIAKVLQYSLAHDMVEVYAGDTYFYSTEKNASKNKIIREKKAALKLEKNFKEFKAMHDIIHAYEARKDKESKFVYALDKIQPILKIYIDNGRLWKKKKVSLEMLVENKTNKVAVDPHVKEIFNDLVKILEKNKKRLF